MTTPNQRYAITNLCARIQTAAIKCDALHIFVHYSPHVASLTVYAHCVYTDYDDPGRLVDRLVDRTVYLDDDNVAENLLTVIGEIKALGVEI